MNNRQLDNDAGYVVEDEIDLVQLFLVLKKRKYLILCVLVICIGTGLGFCLLRTPTYEYTTTLQVGTTLGGDDAQVEKKSLESVDIAAIKIEKVYLPAVINSVMNDMGRMVSGKVTVQKNSDVLLLVSEGKAEEQDFYRNIHERIMSPLVEEHRQLMAAARKPYELMVEKTTLTLKELEDPRIYLFEEQVLEGKIKEARAKLAEYDDQKKFLEDKEKRLTESKRLLQEQITKIEETLVLAYANRAKASDEARDEAKALTFLMVNNQIEQNENRLAGLQERLHVHLENDRQQLEVQQAENRRIWDLQKDRIAELQSQLVRQKATHETQLSLQENAISDAQSKVESFQSTRIMDSAVRSVNPKGLGASLIMVLAGMLGLMSGVMLAFIVEFMNKVREQEMTKEPESV